ncbi:hypothetical protein O159_17660 [Leifsonia xyli subsp. cynodontis DSM 46306]|uniref:Secreted protein n=1 Tax=Leifsonia xyli subsp. cynodontis DSM 46306 TaxID=1389489 RepID=U3P8K1_LEIXC|nr:hypothetical protein [Leifsonia xyli]AGW41804.1 hypothetical protein O159_17660 [Leifsonia xyli subsp. cynodontis DSM 46306]
MKKTFPQALVPFAAGAFAVALTVMGAAPASAAEEGCSFSKEEGCWFSKLSQVQPTFVSRIWIDKGLTRNSTVVFLGGCKANSGGGTPVAAKVKSITLTLQSLGDDQPAPLWHDFKSVRLPGCGTFDFGRAVTQRGDDTWRFQVSAINRENGPGRNWFLDASKVTMTY